MQWWFAYWNFSSGEGTGRVFPVASSEKYLDLLTNYGGNRVTEGHGPYNSNEEAKADLQKLISGRHKVSCSF